MTRRWLRVAAVQMHANDDIEKNAREIVDRLNACASKRVDVAAFHEGVIFGYCDRPDFWTHLDQSRIERAERQIVREACAHPPVRSLCRRLDAVDVTRQGGAVTDLEMLRF